MVLLGSTPVVIPSTKALQTGARAALLVSSSITVQDFHQRLHGSPNTQCSLDVCDDLRSCTLFHSSRVCWAGDNPLLAVPPDDGLVILSLERVVPGADVPTREPVGPKPPAEAIGISDPRAVNKLDVVLALDLGDPRLGPEGEGLLRLPGSKHRASAEPDGSGASRVDEGGIPIPVGDKGEKPSSND